MYNILVIGMTGQGKSTFVKNYIAGRNCCVFDVQNEYVELSATDKRATRYRNTTCNIKSFIADCKMRRNTVCVYEEATGFFQGAMAEDVRQQMISKRHTGNVNIFIFHSIASVPPRIMQLTNFVVLHKTGDEPYQVEKKYPSLFQAFLKLKDAPQYSYEIINII